MTKPVLLSILTAPALFAVLLGVVRTTAGAANGFPRFEDSAAATTAGIPVAAIGSQALEIFELNLAPGWNLVSLPLPPANPDISAVFGGVPSIDEIVTSVDVSVGGTISCAPPMPSSIGEDCVSAARSGDVFVGALTHIRAGKGYWVLTSSFEPVYVQLSGLGVGAGLIPPVTPLSSGFNLIGLRTFDALPAGDAYPADETFYALGSHIIEAYWFDTVASSFVFLSPDADEQVLLGRGYYVFSSEPGVLLPEPTAPPSAVLGADVTGSSASLPMSSGWNFVSLPGMPADTSIDAVLPQSVPVTVAVSYDPDFPGGFLVAIRDVGDPWVGTLHTIQDGRGYLLLSSSPFTLSIALTPFDGEPKYSLVEGWNAVGVTVIDFEAMEDLDSDGQAAEFSASDYLATVDWLGAYLFDAATQTWQGMKAGSQSAAQVVKAGKGYWLFLEADGELQPPVTPTAPICGDLNGDGDVNVFDAIIDLQIIVGLIEPTPDQLVLSDLNRDGTTNVFDAILLLQDIVGLTEITGCGPSAP